MKEKIFKIVLMRHGESLGNLENRFTGWLDVDLTKDGHLESYKTGIILKDMGYDFELCYTSMLKRAYKTAWTVLDAMDLLHIKTIRSINLNERNYGGILGMNKLEAVIKYGKENLYKWLNNYYQNPPPLDKGDLRLKILKKVYKKKKIPINESLNDLLIRVLLFWNKEIKKKIVKKKIIIVAHSNILKILMNYIDKKTVDELLDNSTPIVYEFTEKLKKIKSYAL